MTDTAIHVGATRRSIAARLLTVLVVAPASAAQAADADPAIVRVQSLSDALATSARKGELRGARMRQILDQAFNLQVMAEVAVGPAWNSFSAADRSSVLDALSRYTAARFAHEFADYGGQPIQIDPMVQVRGLDRLVRAEIRDPGEPPQKIGYRLREYAGQWRVIDVIYNGVSQLATQRSDFAGAISAGGAPALVKRLDQATAKLK